MSPVIYGQRYAPNDTLHIYRTHGTIYANEFVGLKTTSGEIFQHLYEAGFESDMLPDEETEITEAEQQTENAGLTSISWPRTTSTTCGKTARQRTLRTKNDYLVNSYQDSELARLNL